MRIVKTLNRLLYNFYDGYIININQFYQDTKVIRDINKRLSSENQYFFRMELYKPNITNEAAWHNLRSIGIFSSTVIGDMIFFMNKNGFNAGANQYHYIGANSLLNALFNIKYLLVRMGMEENINKNDFEYHSTVGNVMVYENKHSLPIGFMVKDSIKEWNINNPYTYLVQNDFIEKAIGYHGIYETVTFPVSCEGMNCNVVLLEENRSRYSLATGSVLIKYNIEVIEAIDLYINAKGNYISKLNVLVNDQVLYHNITQLNNLRIGLVNAGDKVEVQLIMSESVLSEGTVGIDTLTYQQEHFLSAYNELKQHALKVGRYSDGYITGTISVSDNKNILFMSIPYDTGWTAYVNGSKTNTIKIGNALIGLELQEGTHEIELRYCSPGFMTGLVITVLSSLVFIVICYYRIGRFHSDEK